MKSKSAKDTVAMFRGLEKKELKAKINEIRRELFQARLMVTTSSLKDFSTIKKLKKDIARGLTILGKDGF